MEYFVHLGADSVDAIKQACGTEIEELNVTENGTYTADSGKAYNPVTVNVESGGGGDSDFSTAEVTVINNSTYTFSVDIPMIVETDEYTGIISGLRDVEGEMAFITPLYKGKTVIIIINTGFHWNIVLTGNIVNIDGDAYLVTGNCTISASYNE